MWLVFLPVLWICSLLFMLHYWTPFLLWTLYCWPFNQYCWKLCFQFPVRFWLLSDICDHFFFWAKQSDSQRPFCADIFSSWMKTFVPMKYFETNYSSSLLHYIIHSLQSKHKLFDTAVNNVLPTDKVNVMQQASCTYCLSFTSLLNISLSCSDSPVPFLLSASKTSCISRQCSSKLLFLP